MPQDGKVPRLQLPGKPVADWIAESDKIWAYLIALAIATNLTPSG